MPQRRSWSWRRILGEAVLIIGSVYLAIVLEGISADREQRAEARVSLAQVRSDLVADKADLQEILAEQRTLAGIYRKLAEWLASPDTMPVEQVHETLIRLGDSNRTMFPRKGAWTSMVSSGQLIWLGDPDLASRLGNLYGNINERIEYNGRDYDHNLNEVARVTISAAWDRQRRQPMGDLTRLRNELLYLESAWNTFYMNLLLEYEVELEALIADIDRHLAAADGGARPGSGELEGENGGSE